MTTIPIREIAANKQIIVCIPAYNEGKTIGDIISKAKAFCTEVMVCDDGSIDNTSEVAKENGAIVIRNSNNRGYGRTLNNLFKHAVLRNQI